MSRLTLSIALGAYDHVRDLTEGIIRPDGLDLVGMHFQPEEVFFRFLRFREFDISEVSFAKYIAMASSPQGCDFIALPVFPSRVFRHSSIYVRADAGITRPQDLAGRRVGLPEWAQTAAIYSRGLLAHEYGVDLRSIDWVQAGVNQPGRKEKVALALPEGLRCTPAPQASLSSLLADGGIDAALTARPPEAFLRGDGRVVRLFADYRETELDYWRRTGIFPIMHVVVLRREVHERHPWVAMNLLKAFEQAKEASQARALDITCSAFPVPWLPDHAEQARSLMGGDLWPYGVDANQATLRAFTQYAYEQGVAQRLMAPEELFAPQTLERFKV
ncbi:ABC transporter substrate-binding protein [Ramlibacter sp. MAHUQ-53]|uniref:ABC transporter substrate-binding protein n=1 Tax=unclassified Ramlibacter TaxID=2617605 RepID=UPI0036330618